MQQTVYLRDEGQQVEVRIDVYHRGITLAVIDENDDVQGDVYVELYKGVVKVYVWCYEDEEMQLQAEKVLLEVKQCTGKQ